MSIELRLALGVGQKFAIVNGSKVGHIAIKNTHTLVKVDDEVFPLYKGKTYEDSRKVDEYFDNNSVKEMDINDHIVPKEQEYDVVISRTGCVKVVAKSIEEALEKANALPESSITWSDDWFATDAYQQ